jgi:tRNA nucleotidyltransferase (CCA-adding enzyme)
MLAVCRRQPGVTSLSQRVADPAFLKQWAQRVPAPVHHVVQTLARAGHPSVVVGGAVRDLVLDTVPGDFDVATAATPQEVVALFKRTIPTGIQHGTVTVVEHDSDGTPIPVEVTTFRTEGGYQDGRRPESVSFVRELDEDLSRRDFTINAMALHLWPDALLADPFGGIADLTSRTLRTVGSADTRFQEDGLRAIRAARFASQLHLESAPGLEDAMRRALPVVEKVAPERFLQELRKLFENSTRPAHGLRMLERTGLLALLAPRAPRDEGSLARVDRVPARTPEARWAAWLWDAGKDGARATLLGLKASSALQDDAAALANAPRPAAMASADAWELRKVVRAVGKKRLVWLSALWASEEGEPLVRRVEEALQQGYVESPAALALDGNTLQQLTGARGKALGDLLKALLDHVDRHPDSNTPQALGEAARSLHKP